MIAKDLLPWLFVKRTAAWTPYVRIRSEVRLLQVSPVAVKPVRRPLRRPPRG